MLVHVEKIDGKWREGELPMPFEARDIERRDIEAYVRPSQFSRGFHDMIHGR